MTAITPERAQEIRARLEAAVPGPWVLFTDSDYPQRVVANDDGLVLIAEIYTDPAWPPADAALIAHAPTDLADLLDERDLLLAVVQAADEYESVLGRFGIDVGGPLTRLCAAVRAYRAATTGEAGQ